MGEGSIENRTKDRMEQLTTRWRNIFRYNTPNPIEDIDKAIEEQNKTIDAINNGQTKAGPFDLMPKEHYEDNKRELEELKALVEQYGLPEIKEPVVKTEGADKPLQKLSDVKKFMESIGYKGSMSNTMTSSSTGKKIVKYYANGVVTPTITLGETTPRDIWRQFHLYGNIMDVEIPADIKSDLDKEREEYRKVQDELQASDIERTKNILTEAGIPFTDVIDSERGVRIVFTDRKNDNGNYVDYTDYADAEQVQDSLNFIRVKAEQPKQQKTGGEATKTSERDRGLLEVVMDKLRNIIGDRLHTTLTEDEKGLINWARAAYHRVFHGSGADFERFDSSHMGEGEGAQAYGYGHYTTEVEGIGRTYAKAMGQYEYQGRKYNDIRDYWEGDDATQRVVLDVLKYLDKDNDTRSVQEAIDFSVKVRELRIARNIGDVEEAKRELDALKNLSAEDFKTSATLYTVEIPDDNGSNYLEWDKPASMAQVIAIKNALIENKKFVEDGKKAYDFHFKNYNADEVPPFEEWIENHAIVVARGAESNGERLYKELTGELGSEKAASELLHDAGFVGIKYPAQYRSGGREDNAKNYVIFDDGDLKITDKIKFFKTPQGEVYGFTVGGNIYVDMDIAKADTPIHEYGHLWVPMVRESDPEMWEDIKSVLTKDKDVKPFMDIVRQRYPELTAEGREDDFMEEVFTHFSGDNGLKMLEEAAREYEEQDGQGFISKAKAIAALNKVKEALDKFWGKVAQLFGIKFRNAREVANKMFKDFMDEVDPTKVAKVDNGKIRFQKADNKSTERENDGTLFRSLNPESDEVVDNAEVGTKPLSDREKVAKLEAEPKVKVYRSMQLIDGKLYPPMSAKVDGQLREPSELGVWEEADEAPDMADENGKFKLDKGNRKSLKAAYNPYIHTSRTMLNDQFSEAQDRPNLVVVEMEVPESELTSGYKAEKAKDSVGAKQWKAGVIQGQLSGTREVILSRWAKPVRIVPTEEVAENIAKQIEGQVQVMPSNVVTPEVREALEARGVKFVETDNTGKITEGPNKGKTWASVYGKKEQAKRDAVNRLAKRFNVDIEVVENPEDIKHSNPAEQEKMRKAPGFYRLGSGKVVIVLPNNRDASDVVSTVMHEVLTHKGLREVIGEDNMPAFLDEIYSHLTDELKKRVDTKMTQEFINDMRSIDHARRVATEEMIGDISDKMPEDMTEKERNLWQKVCDWIRNAIDKLFTELKLPKGYKVTENDIRYMIWKTRQHMEGRKPDYVEMAQDVNKRNELGLDEEIMYSNGGIERAVESAKATAEENKGEADKLKADYEAIGGKLADLRKAMSLQKKFDAGTVRRVTDLALSLIKNGQMDNLRANDVSRLLLAVDNSTGKEDIEDNLRRVVDIMIDSQLRNAEERLHKLESIRGSKVDAKGVVVGAKLDPAGQQYIQTFKEAKDWDEKTLESSINDAENDMDDSNDAIAEEAAWKASAFRRALEYVQNIKQSKADESKFKDELRKVELEIKADEEKIYDYISTPMKDAEGNEIMKNDGSGPRMHTVRVLKPEFKENVTEENQRVLDDTKRSIKQKKEAMDAIEETARQNRIERLQAYNDLMTRLSGSLSDSMTKAKELKEKEVKRVKDIHHMANSDMEGREMKGHNDDTKLQKFNESAFYRWASTPLATYEQMFRLFGRKNPDGKGYTYDLGVRGWADAADGEWKMQRSYYKKLDDKAKELFGKKAKKTYGDVEKKKEGMTFNYWDGAGWRDKVLNQDQMGYLYAVDKMPQGKATNRRMGFTDEVMEEIEKNLDPRLKKFIDWAQEELFPELRAECNEVYRDMFGADMDNIENYFPFVRDPELIKRDEEIGQPKQAKNYIGETTGALKKRTPSVTGWDIPNISAIDAIVKHIDEMSHWKNFARLNRDLNTLVHYKPFRQKVMGMNTVYGGGKRLMERFEKLCAIATDATAQSMIVKNDFFIILLTLF